MSLNRNNQVTAWTNQADTSRSATTEATTITLTSLQNGQKMLAFNSENNVGHLAYGGSASSQFSAGYTVFAVVNLTVAADNTYMRVHRSADDAHALFYGKRSDLNSYESIQMKANPLPMADRPTVGYDGGLVILTSRVTPSRQELYVNGTLVDSNDREIVPTSQTSFQIGNSVVGTIGDVLMYDHTATDRGLGETGQELARRYGLTWDDGILVPEPSVSLLLGVGAIGIWRRRLHHGAD